MRTREAPVEEGGWRLRLRSVAWTDSLQALIMLVTSVLVLLFVIYRYF